MKGISRHLCLFTLILLCSLVAAIHAKDATIFVRSTPEPLHAMLPGITSRYYTLKAGWVPGGPCKSQDYKCMNSYSLKYVNEQRKKSGKKLYNYKMGTMAMLKNALRHSKAMKKRGRCYHQRLDKVNLGCSAFFAAENVAQSHVLLNPGGPTDPAKMCSAQLKKSPPHYRNILSDYNKQFVMAIYVDQQGYIWCTQVFTVFAQYRGGNCKRAPILNKRRQRNNRNKRKRNKRKRNNRNKRRRNKRNKRKRKRPSPTPTRSPTPSPTPSKSPPPSPSPEPYQMASTGHVFKKTEYKQDGKTLPLQCGYCLKEGGYCMPEKESIEFDQGKRPSSKKVDFNKAKGGGDDDDEFGGGEDWDSEEGGEDWGSEEGGEDYGSEEGEGEDW